MPSPGGLFTSCRPDRFSAPRRRNDFASFLPRPFGERRVGAHRLFACFRTGLQQSFGQHTGPTAWLAPLYPFVLSRIFLLFGIQTRTAVFFALSAELLAFGADRHPHIFYWPVHFRSANRQVVAVDVVPFPLLHVLGNPLHLGYRAFHSAFYLAVLVHSGTRANQARCGSGCSTVCCGALQGSATPPNCPSYPSLESGFATTNSARGGHSSAMPPSGPFFSSPLSARGSSETMWYFTNSFRFAATSDWNFTWETLRMRWEFGKSGCILRKTLANSGNISGWARWLTFTPS